MRRARLALASANPGKITEFQSLRQDHVAEVISQAELGVDSAPETGIGFIANALIRARHAD